MPLRTLLGLILCNLIWSGNPTMGKLVLADLSPVHGTWLRYLSALIALLIFRGVFHSNLSGIRPASASRGLSQQERFLVFLLGISTFCVGPILQLTGLASSYATENALIVSMEPLITVVLACFFLRERISGLVLVSLAIALVGFIMLTGLSASQFTGVRDAHFLGNLIILISLLGEATYSVLGSRLVRYHSPVSILTQSLCVGVAVLTGISLIWSGFPSFSVMSWRSILGTLWLGPLGTAGTYLFWITVLVQAPVSVVALTLFIQPAAGALWGFCFLNERLTAVQMAGGLLILLAVLGQSLRESQSRLQRDPDSA